MNKKSILEILMKTLKRLIIFFLFCNILLAQDDISSSTVLKVGDQLPSFSVQLLQGKTITSTELKGKVVLINFWATWCPPCKAEMPLIQEDIYNAIHDSRFQVLAISRGEEKEIVKKFIEKTKYTFPIYLDSNKKVYELFATKYIPRNFVIGKDGKIKWLSTGFKQEEFNEMIKVIKQELQVKT
jgi:peroxiredoxin